MSKFITLFIEEIICLLEKNKTIIISTHEKEYFSDIEYEEALASESGVGSIAHSVVLVRVKDASKVDRSAAYMLRHIAKNIVANGYAKKCEIQVSYAIGMKEPLSIYVNTFSNSGFKKITSMINAKCIIT